MMRTFSKLPVTRGSGLRFVTTLVSSAVITTGVIYTNYYNYWKGTIYRVQTVDFNILANLLPSKLSIQLAKGDTKGIQQTIDSNYGLFGIVITDCQNVERSCPGQKILYASKSRVSDLSNGRQQLFPQNGYAEVWTKEFQDQIGSGELFKNELFMLLRNPPPFTQESGFRSPHDEVPTAFSGQNSDKVIGRVYLLRADPPPFTQEIQTWFVDLPNSLLGKRISSRNLLYNSIAISSSLAAIVVWVLLELAYYQTRLAQEKERKAVEAKLNAETKLRLADHRNEQALREKEEAEESARIAAQKSEQALREKEEAEEFARIAAQKSEQALREKDEAEESADAVGQTEEFARIAAQKNEQALREKEETEEFARIVAQKNEQALREKEEAEEFARIAAQKSEQALKEKEEAEKAARIATQEREQARRDADYLYRSIEEQATQATRELEERVSELETENRQLKAKKNVPSIVEPYNESETIALKVTEKDYYLQEREELLLDILRNALNNVHQDSRRQHILQNVIANNVFNGERKDLKSKIRNLLQNYQGMNTQTENALERLGFVVISEANHLKIRFCEDERYTFSLSKTPGDYRAGRNMARDICNKLL